MGVIRWLQRHSGRAHPIRRHAASQRCKLELERLEDRWLPSQTTIQSVVPSPSNFGQTVTFTATVAPTVSEPATPTGSVGFFEIVGGVPTFLGSTGPLTPGSGAESTGAFTTFDTQLRAGTHVIFASYQSDDGRHLNSQSSPPTNHTVNPAPTTTTIVSAVPGPSTFGDTVTFTITVAPGFSDVDPPGVLHLFDGATFLGDSTTLTDDGTGVVSATFTTAPIQLSGGPHDITAVYDGSADFTPSTSAIFTHIVNRAPTTTTIVQSNPTPATFGQPITFTVTVESQVGQALPTGRVTFRDGPTVLGQSTDLVGGSGTATATFTTQPTQLSGGGHAIRATYDGDGNFDVSPSAVFNQVVNQANTVVTITNVKPSPSTFGEAFTVTFTVTPAQGGVLPTGQLTLSEDGIALGTSTPLAFAGGVATATFTTAPTQLNAGLHNLQAIYPGDNNYRGGGSAVAQHQVNRAPTATSLTASDASPVVGQPVTFTATVQPQPASAGVPTGSVNFLVDGVQQANVALDQAGRATFQFTFANAGGHVVRAEYGGGGNFLASAQAADVSAGQNGVKAFVEQVYRDLLGRPPTPGEVAGWTVFLSSGRKPSDLARAILNTREHRLRQMNTLFDIYLPCHHDPLEEGPEQRVNIPLTGKSPEKISAEILGTTLYFNERGGGTNGGFVKVMFQDVLHRAPRKLELARYLGLLRTHSRAQVATRLLTSTEYYRTVVGDLFQQYLNRKPSAVEVRQYVAKLQQGASQDSIIAILIGLREYVTKP